MIGSECSVRKEEGPGMAERTGMDVVVSKANFPAHRAVIPGKEEFCFFVCPYPRHPGGALRSRS